MSNHATRKKVSHGLGRLFRVLSRPARHTVTQGSIVIQPYRGYGYRDRAFFMGRVVRQPRLAAMDRGPGVLDDLVFILRRFLRRGIAGTEVTARAHGSEHRAVTDKDGYYSFNIQVPDSSGWQGEWRNIDLHLPDPQYGDVGAQSPVYFPPETCQRVVISDIDDTVMYTGVANKAKMLWRLFATSAEDRLAFPGVGVFYRELHKGVSGSDGNPMIYVSRAPWTIYEVIEEFFRIHDIPVGPVLFLREWGMTLQRPLPKQSKGHKRKLVEETLAIYDNLPFVLIGDSGQRDPEIYADVVRDNPSRVSAVYIRNVSHDEGRADAIERLAKEMVEAGSSLVLAADSYAMAAHAADHGLLSGDGLDAVRDAQLDDGEAASHASRPITRPKPADSAGSEDRPDLRKTLKRTPEEEPHKSIVVE